MKKSHIIAVVTGAVLLVALSLINLLLIIERNNDPDNEIQTVVNKSVQAEVAKLKATIPTEQVIHTIEGQQGANGKSVTGPKGDTGPQGPAGPAGKDGVAAKGDKGEDGKTLEIRWSASGKLQERYTGDDFWIDVETEATNGL